ncbi:MAG: signal peptide peptidase SppA [Candidatus Rokuibacteriota bacterium]
MRQGLRLAGTTALIWAVVAALFLMSVAGIARRAEGAFFGPKVALLELEGIIVDADELVRELKAHRDNPLVRAVVIRINSPGGIVGPTQELHQAIVKMRQAGKPVVASLAGVAASGGYYVAVAADQIYANPGTLTGSIGVIMQTANLEQLMKKVGVDFVVVKSGDYKDIGSFARPMTAEERRVLQALLDDVHGQFIGAVAEGRRLDRARVAQFADGRIFSGAQAKALGMVDALGGLEEAVAAAGKLAGLPGPPSVLPPRRKISITDILRNQLGGAAGSVIRPGLPMFKTPLYLMD